VAPHASTSSRLRDDALQDWLTSNHPLLARTDRRCWDDVGGQQGLDVVPRCVTRRHEGWEAAAAAAFRIRSGVDE
jgi:hypothetical protein